MIQPSLFSEEMMDSQRVEPEPPLHIYCSKRGDLIIATDMDDAVTIYEAHYDDGPDSGVELSKFKGDTVHYRISDLGVYIYNSDRGDWVDWIDQAVPYYDFIDHFGRGLAVESSDD